MQYAGYYLHQPSGLNQTWFREYAAGLGRWLSRDAVAESAGTNLYCYVLNAPSDSIDPMGLDGFLQICAVQTASSDKNSGPGHCWINWVPTTDSPIAGGTYGTWGLRGGFTLHHGWEKDIQPTACAQAKIGEDGEAALRGKIVQYASPN